MRFLSPIVLVVLLAGCGSSAPGAPSQPASSSLTAGSRQGEWDQTVAAAKVEGKVAILTSPGDEIRRYFDVFQQRFGIATELLVGNGQADLAPKVVTERQAGVFRWDVMMHSPSMGFGGLKPAGALDPLRPTLVLPDVLDNSKWLAGFDGGWADSDRSTTYSFVAELDWTAYVNRNLVAIDQLNKVDQLWEPRWRGKIAWQDPRVPSKGSGRAADILQQKGEDRLRALLGPQQPVVTNDRRQLAEWLIRGQYPAAITLDWNALSLFQAQGVNFDYVKPLADDDPVAAGVSSSSGAVALINRAPHPNAAKVLVNWMLSQEGQSAYAKLTGHNSRRLDIPAVNQVIAVDPKKSYRTKGSNEADFPLTQRAIDIARQTIT